MRYRLIDDDSGHWFLCPDGRQDEANAAIEAIERHYEDAVYHPTEPPELPDWLIALDGPYSLSFTDPKEDE